MVGVDITWSLTVSITLKLQCQRKIDQHAFPPIGLGMMSTLHLVHPEQYQTLASGGLAPQTQISNGLRFLGIA